MGREDQLLQKLKQCVGNLPNTSTTNPQKTPQQKHSLSALKQNYCHPQPKNVSVNKFQSKVNHYDNPKEISQRTPLSLNYNSNIQVPSGNFHQKITERHNYQPIQQYSSVNIRRKQHSTKANIEKKIQNYESINSKRYEYGLDRIKKYQIQQVQPTYEENLNKVNTERYRGHDKVQERITKPQSSYPSHESRQYSKVYSGNQTQRSYTSKKYQEEVVERKKIVQAQNPHHSSNYNEILIQKKEKQNNFPLKMQNLPTNRQRHQAPLETRNSVILDKKQRLINIHESYKKQLAEGDVSKTKSSAIEKLKKISELNEKINDRIRNIINVFEENR